MQIDTHHIYIRYIKYLRFHLHPQNLTVSSTKMENIIDGDGGGVDGAVRIGRGGEGVNFDGCKWVEFVPCNYNKKYKDREIYIGQTYET